MRPEGTIVISIENHYCRSVCVTGPEGKQGVLSGSLHWSNRARTGADVVAIFSIDSCRIDLYYFTLGCFSPRSVILKFFVLVLIYFSWPGETQTCFPPMSVAVSVLLEENIVPIKCETHNRLLNLLKVKCVTSAPLTPTNTVRFSSLLHDARVFWVVARVMLCGC